METENNFDLASAFKNGRSKSIKILWIIILCFSFYGLSYYVRECYVRLKVTPAILISENLINSREIPFPAVTICPPFGIKNELFKLDLEQKYKVKFNNEMLKANFVPTFDPLESIQDSTLKSHNANMVELFNTISPQINDVLNTCTVTGHSNYFECDQIYTRTLTNFGYCFTFNMLNFSSVFQKDISEDFSSYKQANHKNFWVRGIHSDSLKDTEKHKTDVWSLEYGYTLKDELVKPQRATKALSIFTDTREQYHEDFDICEDIYKVIFHLPNEVPTSLNIVTNVKFGHMKVLTLTAEIIKHDDTLDQFHPVERGCYFDGERKLKFFSSYSKNNCEHECMINFMLLKCGCVKFTMPRTRNMKVCDVDDIHCNHLIFKEWPGSFYDDSENRRKHPDYPCNCMPPCTQIKYELTDKSSDKKIKGKKYSNITLNINFGNNHIVKKTHFVPYKVQNFVSDIGGLLGLFLGFSLLSMIQMILKCLSVAIKYIQKFIPKKSNRNEVQNVYIVSSKKVNDLVIIDIE